MTSAATRDDLQAFLSAPTGDTLGLGGTSWRATASGFEVANIELANTYSTLDTATPLNNYTDINTTWKTVISSTEIIGLAGTAGNDLVVANGVGIVTGLAGNDVLVALDGGNTLDGGANNDFLLGGDGIDTLIGGTASDVLAGGAGNDTFVLNADVLGNVALGDIIVDYAAGDVIDLSEVFVVDGNGGLSDHIRMSGTSLQVDTDGTLGVQTWQTVGTVTGFVDNGVNHVSILYDNNGADDTPGTAS